LAKEEMLRRRTLPALPKKAAGRTFSSKLVIPTTLYAAALMSNIHQHHQGQPTPSKDPSGDQQATHLTAQATRKEAKTLNTPTHTDIVVREASHSLGQSVQANNVNSFLNKMFKVVSVIQHNRTEINGAIREKK
jgi:hypothetical protein